MGTTFNNPKIVANDGSFYEPQAVVLEDNWIILVNPSTGKYSMILPLHTIREIRF